jgi:LysM repeat protein
LNNYRYGGLSASGLISKNPEDMVYNSAATAVVPAVRDMISEYVASTGKLMPECDNNWEIIGYDFDYVGTEKVYEMILKGEISIPSSTDGRTSNIKAVNMKELAEQGLITAAEAKRVEEASIKADTDQGEAEEVNDVVKDEEIKYLVVKGDCLYRLAKKFNCSISEILELNPKIKNPDIIYVGQILLLPE